MSIWYVLLFALGLLMALKPRVFWQLERLLTMRRGEANETYCKITRICGGCFCIVSVIMAILSLL